MFSSKYHLPHNAVRIDEFNHMLNSIDLNKEFYTYKELRLLFLQRQIESNTLVVFHKRYDLNLRTHKDSIVRDVYEDAIMCPNEENINRLLEVKYTPRKTFKQVWNETVRDYTEFFAFLGLLPTYYKGRARGENRHYISKYLIDYRNSKISLHDIVMDFKFRNASKDEDKYNMYSVTLRPFIVALKALKYFFDLGYTKVNRKIISAIVVYATNDSDEKIKDLCDSFSNPEDSLVVYESLFGDQFKSVNDELGRASTFLTPYLKEMGYIKDMSRKAYYSPGSKIIDLTLFPRNAVYCGSQIGMSGIDLTPEVGKIIFQLLQFARDGVKSIHKTDFFDNGLDSLDQEFVISVLGSMGCIGYNASRGIINIFPVENQFSINPFSDFYSYSDANYVNSGKKIKLDTITIKRQNRYSKFEEDISAIGPIANGSNGAKYEEAIYNLLKAYFPMFNTTWYGQSCTGQRFSDIYITTDILDEDNQVQKIAIIIECKAGGAIRTLDERKESDDIKRTLKANNGDKISGVWYWVVDSNSIPSVDTHGGYRNNDNSLSFMEKLNYLQYAILANKHVPSLVTAFSFEAIKGYLTYLYTQLNENGPIEEINRINAPHFWVWSKKFMHLQYVQVYKEWR